MDVLRNFVFWMRFLACGQKEIRIPAGSGSLVLSALSGTASMNVESKTATLDWRTDAHGHDEMDAVEDDVALAHDEEEGGPPDEIPQE